MFSIKFNRDDAAAAPEGVYITARLNARLQPMDRGDHFEDPLTDALEDGDLGEVTGGGTQLADEPEGIEFCDLEIRLNAADDITIVAVTERLEALGAPRGSKLIIGDEGKEVPFGVNEGLALFLNGVDLDDEVYETSDVNHVIEECERLMGEGGRFYSHWQGSRETALYFYGPSFNGMKAAIEAFVAAYPLCEKSRIEQIA